MPRICGNITVHVGDLDSRSLASIIQTVSRHGPTIRPEQVYFQLKPVAVRLRDVILVLGPSTTADAWCEWVLEDLQMSVGPVKGVELEYIVLAPAETTKAHAGEI